MAILSNVAELGPARMEEKIGKANLRDATIGTGVAVDKMLALTGQMPGLNVNIANIPMPTEAERAERDRAHRALDEIAMSQAPTLRLITSTKSSPARFGRYTQRTVLP